MLLGFDALESLLPDAMRAPDLSPSSAKSELERREPDPERPILDPRDGDAEDDASSPKQKSLLAIAGSLLAEISLTKLLLAWIASIVPPAAILGLAPLVVSAWIGDVFLQSSGIDRNRRSPRAARRGAGGLVRLAPVVSRCGSEFLGAQRAWRSAGIRLVPRGDPSFGGTISRAGRRSGACAHARNELRRRRHPSRRRRWRSRGFCLACNAVDRIGLGSRGRRIN